MLWEILDALRETIFLVLTATLFVTVATIIAGLLVLFKEKQLKLISNVLHFINDLPIIFVIFFIFVFNKSVFASQNNMFLILCTIIEAAFAKQSLEMYHVFKSVPQSIYEAVMSLGAPSFRLIRHVILPETINGVVKVTINLIKHLFAYSLVCETMSNEGLGGLLISKCIYDLSFSYLTSISCTIILVLTLIQIAGNYIIYGDIRLLSK